MALANLKSSIMFGPVAADLDPKTVSTFYVVDNLRALAPQDLEDEQIFIKIAMVVRDVDDEEAGFKAKEAFEILTALIDQNQSLQNLESDLLQKYFALLMVLKANFLGLL